jgi:type VI secretion system secreted protein Hcp
MAVDMFLELDGIKGESKDDAHKDEIDVLSFHWGVDQEGTALGGAGKVVADDLVTQMGYSRASPVLMLACCTGEHIPSGVLTLRKAGGEQLEFLKYKFYDLLVSEYQTSVGGDDNIPLEEVSFSFAKIEVEYTPQKADGSADVPVRRAFDFATAKKA